MKPSGWPAGRRPRFPLTGAATHLDEHRRASISCAERGFRGLGWSLWDKPNFGFSPMQSVSELTEDIGQPNGERREQTFSPLHNTS